MRRYLGLSLVLLFAVVYVASAEIVFVQPVGGGVPVGGSCATTNGVAIFTAATTLGCSGLVASSGNVTTGVWTATVIAGQYGGTGVANTGKTITLGGNLTTSGAFNTTFTVTADTSVTLPTSGTLVNSAVTTLSSLASVGTITTGTWNVSGGSVTAATGVFTTSVTTPLHTTAAGTAIAVTAAAPAVASASTAGAAATLTASAATAGNVTNGAAAGGAVTITSGAAARLVSGNANGGDIIFTTGAGIGTGNSGNVIPTTSGQAFGTANNLWNIAATAVKSYVTTGDGFPTIDLNSTVSRAIAMGPGGSTPPDVFQRRSTTKTLTIDADGVGGALTLFNVVGPQTVSGAVIFSGLTTASGTPNSICQNSGTKEITVNAALTCTVSSRRFKNSIRDQDAAWPILAALTPRAFRMNDSPAWRVGFIAEEVDAVDQRLVSYDAMGRPHSVRYEDIVSVLTKGIQELQGRVALLERELASR